MSERSKAYSEEHIDFKVPESKILQIIYLPGAETIQATKANQESSEDVASEKDDRPQDFGREAPRDPKAIRPPAYPYPTISRRFPVGPGAIGRRKRR